MAYFFFIDESGIDRRESPYEVITGIAIRDSDLWKVVTSLKNTEEQLFGIRYGGADREIKGKKFLKQKVFKQAQLFPNFNPEERKQLAQECLLSGQKATPKHLSALAQAKLEYVKQLLELCSQFRIKVFASITSEPQRITDDEAEGLLRRNYVYVLERMYYYLEDKRTDEQDIVVFDEFEKSQSHKFVSEIENYFKRTTKGRQRSNLIIPEPFFVHSDLTTGIQIADLVAYIISWGMRLNFMTKPARKELTDYTELIKPLRYITQREFGENEQKQIWSITYIK
jgi:hypothetical protein